MRDALICCYRSSYSISVCECNKRGNCTTLIWAPV